MSASHIIMSRSSELLICTDHYALFIGYPHGPRARAGPGCITQNCHLLLGCRPVKILIVVGEKYVLVIVALDSVLLVDDHGKLVAV